MGNLVEAIQEECNRLREEILPEYEKIPSGSIAAAFMRQNIQRAERAIAEGDVVRCVRELKALREWKL